MKPRGPLLLCALALGCTRPADERTRRELDVGHGTSAALDVNVASGLAVVRALTSDSVALWSSAPSIDIELVTRGARQVTVEVDNAMPLAELRDAAGAVVAPASGAGLKRKTWLVSLPDGISRFRLATPTAGAPGSLRFALLSDVQEAIDRVEDVYRVIDRQRDLSFVLSAGDLTEEGEDDQFERFQAELATLSLPYYTTLGNHDVAEQSLRYQAWFGRGNFQFVHRGVVFTLIDSASATLDPLAERWLDGWLAGARNAVHIVATHIPPLDPIGTRNASFSSRAEAAALLAKLAAAGVDLTLYGHIHSYYSFENAGIPAHVSGGGGARPEHADDIGRHFVVFDVDAERGVLRARVVRVDHGEDVDEDE